VAEAIDRFQGQTTSNASSIAQHAALRAVTGDLAPALAMRERFARRREMMLARFARIPGVRVLPPEGAFYVFPDLGDRIRASRIPQVTDSTSLCNYLIDEAKTVCVPGIAFGMENHMRLSYAAGETDIEQGMDRIERALARL
jgi:aspartate/methionine/tyrosine aminotransferase